MSLRINNSSITFYTGTTDNYVMQETDDLSCIINVKQLGQGFTFDTNGFIEIEGSSVECYDGKVGVGSTLQIPFDTFVYCSNFVFILEDSKLVCIYRFNIMWDNVKNIDIITVFGDAHIDDFSFESDDDYFYMISNGLVEHLQIFSDSPLMMSLKA